MIGEQIQVNQDGTATIACKVPAQWLPLLNAIAELKGSNVNDLLKMCVQFLIETARVQTEASVDMKVLLHMMRVDANWQTMFNYLTKAKLDIAQVVLILQQYEDRHDGNIKHGNKLQPREGFGLAMFDKPFCGECRQTLCVDEIVERVIQVAMGKSDYWDMRQVAQHFEAETIREALIRMVDAQNIINMDAENRDELPSEGDIAPNGRPLTYGNRTKRKKHYDPDTMPQQMTIVFDDADREACEAEVQDWEGEYRQHEEPPSSITQEQ